MGVVKEGAIFLDVGMGKGRVIKNCALFYPEMKHIVGIELVKDRFETAKKATAELDYWLQEKITLVSGDFFEEYWGNANIIWINNLCFGKKITCEIGKKIELECEKGTWIFT